MLPRHRLKRSSCTLDEGVLVHGAEASVLGDGLERAVDREDEAVVVEHGGDAIADGANRGGVAHEAGFSSQKEPTPSASIRVRAKQSMACAGVWTIGSFSLKEVLSRTGMSVFFSKAAMRS